MSEGTLKDRYDIYTVACHDGFGGDLSTGEPLMTFEEWLNESSVQAIVSLSLL